MNDFELLSCSLERDRIGDEGKGKEARRQSKRSSYGQYKTILNLTGPTQNRSVWLTALRSRGLSFFSLRRSLPALKHIGTQKAGKTTYCKM